MASQRSSTWEITRAAQATELPLRPATARLDVDIESRFVQQDLPAMDALVAAGSFTQNLQLKDSSDTNHISPL